MDEALITAIADAMRGRGVDDPALCGDVYESRLAADRTARRAGGAYYTPHYVVELVVERTLQPVLARCTAKEALSLRVLDPACGGGAFLLEVLRQIERHCLAHGVPADRLRRRIAERCLFGFDIDAQAVAVTKLAITFAAGHACEVPGVVEADALRGEEHGAFDVIVGNPPWGQKGFHFLPEQAAYLRHRYATGSGVLDPFKLFVERAHELLRSGGRWGLVLPDIVLLKNQQPVRDLIRTRSRIDWIVDAGRAFDSVNLDAVVLVGELADTLDPAHEVSIWRTLGDQWRDRPPPTFRRAQSVFGELPGHRFNIHAEDRSLALVRRLRAFPRLGEVISFHEGVHSGNMRAKLFVEHEPAHGNCAPLVLGRREVSRYNIAWAGRWLDLGVEREPGEYANLGRQRWHRQRKLIVRRTGDHIVAAYDGRGFFVSNNVFVSEFAQRTRADEQRAWVALLNSPFMTWYFRAVQPRTGRLFAELKIEHLRDFPVPTPQVWDEAWPHLARLARRAERAAARGGPLDDRTAEAIADLVAEMFELAGGERDMVRDLGYDGIQ